MNRAAPCRFLALLLAAVLLGGAPASAHDPIPAFPGAEGFGMYSVGGRGGSVIAVTTLDDSGEGSLRAAIEAEGPRTVIFHVAGTISLLSELAITNPYITIAGQTAPGGGITLRNDPGNKRPTLAIRTHDVILRYIRIRPGPSLEPSCCLDGLQINQAQNVIVDHVSVSWATDGVLDINDAKNITVQWSIIAEGLHDSTNERGTGSRGMLVIYSQGVTLRHNLYAHNKERNPRVASAGVVDIVNNVIYNPVAVPTVLSAESGPLLVNYINNYLKAGPSTGQDTVYPIAFTDEANYERGVFAQDNFFEGMPLVNENDTKAVRPSNRDLIVTTPYDAPPVTTTTAKEALEQVLAAAGAVLPQRDSIDTRLIDQVLNGGGAIIDHPAQVGGWETAPSGIPYLDTDGDGMPDDYEQAHELDPLDPADGAQEASDGYTHLEHFLNALANSSP